MSAEFRIGQAVPRRRADWSDTLLKHASRAALALAAFACFWLFVLPVVVVALSSVATRWSGTILPPATACAGSNGSARRNTTRC